MKNYVELIVMEIVMYILAYMNKGRGRCISINNLISELAFLGKKNGKYRLFYTIFCITMEILIVISLMCAVLFRSEKNSKFLYSLFWFLVLFISAFGFFEYAIYDTTKLFHKLIILFWGVACLILSVLSFII